MNYELTNTLIWIGVYTAYVIWTILAILLFTFLIRRKWVLLKRTLKYTLNTTVFLIAWMYIFELAIIVRPSIYKTKEETSIALQSWISKHQLNDVYFALTTILVLLAINLLFYFKVEYKKNKKDLLILTTFDTLILFAGIWLTGLSAYFGLMQEVNRHFR
jgi:hypothetical protein